MGTLCWLESGSDSRFRHEPDPRPLRTNSKCKPSPSDVRWTWGVQFEKLDLLRPNDFPYSFELAVFIGSARGDSTQVGYILQCLSETKDMVAKCSSRLSPESRMKSMCGPNFLVLWVVCLALVRYVSMKTPELPSNEHSIKVTQDYHPTITTVEVKELTKILEEALKKAFPGLQSCRQKVLAPIEHNPQSIVELFNALGSSFNHTPSDMEAFKKVWETWRTNHKLDENSSEKLISLIIEDLRQNHVAEKITELGVNSPMTEIQTTSASAKHGHIRRRDDHTQLKSIVNWIAVLGKTFLFLWAHIVVDTFYRLVSFGTFVKDVMYLGLLCVVALIVLNVAIPIKFLNIMGSALFCPNYDLKLNGDDFKRRIEDSVMLILV